MALNRIPCRESYVITHHRCFYDWILFSNNPSCAEAGMLWVNAGNVSPPPRVNDPGMHHGTCMTHLPRCMPGSLTNGFLWSQWRGNVPSIPGACAIRNFTYLVRGPWRAISNLINLIGFRDDGKCKHFPGNNWTRQGLNWRNSFERLLVSRLASGKIVPEI